MANEKTYYNHAFDLGFTVMSTSPNGEASNEEIMTGLRRRLASLESNPDDIQESASCYDPSDEPTTQEEYDKWKNQK